MARAIEQPVPGIMVGHGLPDFPKGFTAIGHPAWTTFLTDPFAKGFPELALRTALHGHLLARLGPLTAANHATHAAPGGDRGIAEAGALGRSSACPTRRTGCSSTPSTRRCSTRGDGRCRRCEGWG
ncbi:hypothetical protein [Nonomuraea sp. NPDC048916]|uniref:hypothetical protein n=1 Tax=Nonomuraea sp. NPDC048916 TaxID=3154232 RepID=UPI00340B39E3